MRRNVYWGTILKKSRYTKSYHRELDRLFSYSRFLLSSQKRGMRHENSVFQNWKYWTYRQHPFFQPPFDPLLFFHLEPYNLVEGGQITPPPLAPPPCWAQFTHKKYIVPNMAAPIAGDTICASLRSCRTLDSPSFLKAETRSSSENTFSVLPNYTTL